MRISTTVEAETWDDRWAVPGKAAQPIRAARVSGEDLRNRVDAACRAAGGAGHAVADAVAFLGWRWNAREDVQGRNPTRGWRQWAARLSGAILAAAGSGDRWVAREITGTYGQPRHVRGRSRTIEMRTPQAQAWAALERQGFCVHRLARAVSRVRRTVWVRWGIYIPRRMALAALATHGVRQAAIRVVYMAAGLRCQTRYADAVSHLPAACRVAREPWERRELLSAAWPDQLVGPLGPTQVVDGVDTIAIGPGRVIHGVTVTPAVFGGQVGHLIGRGERTYHSVTDDARAAARDALKAWGRSRQAARLMRAEYPLLERLTPLVRREDSAQAGNCEAGTVAFARRHGWAGRAFVPVTWLLAMANPNARRVAALVLAREEAA